MNWIITVGYDWLTCLFTIGVCEWLYLGFMYMDWDVDYNWDLHILD